MIDLEMVDGLYEASRATGVLMQFATSDKRVLFPLAQLAEAARKARTGITPDELCRMAESGWFPCSPAQALTAASKVRRFMCPRE